MSHKRVRPRGEPADLETAREHGLAAAEYEQLVDMLGRRPNELELGVASALWSEHCSYKSSKKVLAEFPTEGPYVLHGPGENAGVVDIGHGLVAVFKMESHNHPSFIEPYQGAATGVGGILRDIFTMGARPIALLDSLRFGDLEAPRMRHLVDGVVRGIGDYGNCMGIPTVGGETGFHPSYNGNILVNAFALGIARNDAVFTSAAHGDGNSLLYVGSRTGRDGVHGATMASESFDAESEAKRPTVQVGDPFTEKCLLEACLEAMRSDALVAVQDMGAAGLTSSSFEMAHRGGTGFRLNVNAVPLRQADLSPYEIMLSESQERMLLVVERGRENEVAEIFKRWELEVEKIGQVTGDGLGRIFDGSRKIGALPVAGMAENGPIYDREARQPADLAERWKAPEVPEPDDPAATLLKLLATPELGSKEWIYRQYDHTVRTSTVIGPGGDAAVLLLKGTPAGLGLVSDVNPVYCSLDPRVGGRQAVAEALRNLACVGAEPVGLTDCLNFGNPENPEVFWQFRQCVAGMAEACRQFDVPVISGNVSLYNETGDGEGAGRSIHPTPTVAMVGLIPDVKLLPVSYWTTADHRIVLLGQDRREFGGSAYLRLLYDIEIGRPPRVDLAAEEKLADLLRFLAFQGMVGTAHDLSEGGLAVALAEASISGPPGSPRWGAEVTVEGDPLSLFSETQGRALVAVPPPQLDAVLEEAEQHGVPAAEIGRVGGERLRVQASGAVLDVAIEDLYETWRTALPRALGM